MAYHCREIQIQVLSVDYLGLAITTGDDGIPVLLVRRDKKRNLKHETITARLLAKVAGYCNFISKAVTI